MRSDAASPGGDAIGLIAGAGSLPLVLAKAVKARGHPLVCLALEDADPSLLPLADHTYRVQFGQIEEVIAALKRHGARRVLIAGQTVVLKRGVILAVEAAEGTDATIRRGGSLAAGSVVVKAARPDQDPRFDLPTIGAQTVGLLQEVGATVLAVEAGKTLLLDRVEALTVADRAGIAIVGVDVAEAGG